MECTAISDHLCLYKQESKDNQQVENLIHKCDQNGHELRILPLIYNLKLGILFLRNLQHQ